MNRRAFFQRAAIGAAALAVDPERLLWTPGAKTIFVPPAPRIVTGTELERRLREAWHWEHITLAEWMERVERPTSELRRAIELLSIRNDLLDELVFKPATGLEPATSRSGDRSAGVRVL